MPQRTGENLGVHLFDVFVDMRTGEFERFPSRDE
jgi:hypothetical protein